MHETSSTQATGETLQSTFIQSNQKFSINNESIQEEKQIQQFLEIPKQKINIRKRSSRDYQQKQQDIESVNKNRLIQLKEQLLFIRERKKAIPEVADPKIIQTFEELTLKKKNKYEKQSLSEKIAVKEKELVSKRAEIEKYREEYALKSQIFKEKSSLLRIFNNKMENQLSRIKERYREVQFNKVISAGVKKLIYYKIAEIMFNENASAIFQIADKEKDKSEDDSLGVCVGYLGLLMDLIGKISGARMWIKFLFKGGKSTIKSNEGGVIVLHPKDNKFNEGLRLMKEQLYQIMHDTMQIDIENSYNFYELSEELTKELLGIRNVNL